MIQNDLIYAWGLDFKLGYCAQGERWRNVGVVDSQYVLHRGIPTLGDGGKAPASRSRSTSATDRYAVRQRSYDEQQVFNRRWRRRWPRTGAGPTLTGSRRPTTDDHSSDQPERAWEKTILAGRCCIDLA